MIQPKPADKVVVENRSTQFSYRSNGTSPSYSQSFDNDNFSEKTPKSSYSEYVLVIVRKLLLFH